MTKLFKLFLPVAAALTLGACQKIDYKQDLDKYHDNIFVATDQIDGTIYASDEGLINVIGDLYYQSFTVDIKNVQLYPGAPLKHCTVSNMMQYYKEKGESEEEKLIPLYYFFRQESSTRTEGDMDVTSLRYGYLTNTYWLSFTADSRYQVWATPRVRDLYAVKNTIKSHLSAGTQNESAIQPSYRFTVDVNNKTVNVKATAVKFPQDNKDVSQTLSFSSMEWRDIPIEFSPAGYSFYVPELIPIIGGEAAPQHKISELKGEISFDFDGKKTVTYKMLNQYDKTIYITTEFELLRKSL